MVFTQIQGENLDRYLSDVVYPALFQTMDAAFPEFGWKKTGTSWEATVWPSSFPEQVEHEDPGRLKVYPDRPWWIKVHGHEGVRFLDYVNGGRSPSGPEFLDTVRRLCDLAGVQFPERSRTPEQVEKARKKDSRRSALEVLMEWSRKELWRTSGEKARDYLKTERGLTDEEIRDLGIGLYFSTESLRGHLQNHGVDDQAAKDAAVLWPKLEGYLLIPWADAMGRPLTVYGRWPGKTPPKDRPKTIALPGEGTKGSPLFFDRVRAEGIKDVVAVEGVFDASLLQVRGDRRVVAYVAAQFSGEQVQTLRRHGIQSVVLVPDPDSGGDKGVLSSIRSLTKAGIRSFVAPRLPDGLDPDEFLLRDGIEAWRDHVSAGIHAEEFLALQIIQRHKAGNEWTSQTLAAAVDEAVEYDEKITDPERLTDLDLFFWPTIRRETGVDDDAIRERLLAVRKKVSRDEMKKDLKGVLKTAETIGETEGPEKVRAFLLGEAGRLRASFRTQEAEIIRPVSEELEDHEERLSRWRGKEFLGLPQKTLSKLDEWTRGLRGLMLLAAKPNAGKTALAVQLGTDIVVENPEACFVFVSLEMQRWEILTRIKCRLAGMGWKDLVFGTRSIGQFGPRSTGQEVSFTTEEYSKIQRAGEVLQDIGKRLLILDEKNFPDPSVENIAAQVSALREKTGASRAFVLVDYLQVWPIPSEEQKNIRTDLDADKWRIGAMKELRNALEEGDGIMVISEARKPSSDAGWGSALSDVMGSARGSYTPDMVFLLQEVSDRDLGEHTGESPPLGGEDNKAKWRKKIQETRDGWSEDGKSLLTLSIAKGRDGVRRGDIRITFNFFESSFTEGWPRRT